MPTQYVSELPLVEHDLILGVTCALKDQFAESSGRRRSKITSRTRDPQMHTHVADQAIVKFEEVIEAAGMLLLRDR